MPIQSQLKNSRNNTRSKVLCLARRWRESFGVGLIEEFNWRRILDMYTCTECGRCNEHCPTWNTGKPLHPKSLVCDERDHLYACGERM